jgi:hypothetical protein
MNTTSPEFLTFIGYLDFPITTSNLAYLTDLFVPNQAGVSIAEKFIKWKTFYDRSSLQLQIPPQEDNNNQQLSFQLSTIDDDAYSLLNTDAASLEHIFTQPPAIEGSPQQRQLHTPPPPPPPQTPTTSPTTCTAPQLVEYNVEVPHDLIKIEASENCFKNFVLKPCEEETAGGEGIMADHVEVIATSKQQQQPSSSSKGKNIVQMKEIYEASSKAKHVPKPRSRKRKRVDAIETETVSTAPPLAPGRPTKDDALLREANNHDDSDDSGNNTHTQMHMREVQLLSHSGVVRKKIKILTKYPEDIRCFAIKHYASYEYVATQRKKTLEKIKQLRYKLKTLQYIETNLEPYIKDMSSF